MPEACRGGQPNCCKPIIIISWIVLLIVVTFVSLIYFRDCRYYAYITLRSDEKVVFYFAVIYMVYVSFCCYAFIVLAKTGAAYQCCGVARIVWAIIHVGLGITVFALVYPYKSREIMHRHPTELQKKKQVIRRIKMQNARHFPEWFIQFHQAQKCCGLFESYTDPELLERCDQEFKDDPGLQRGCGWVLYELYDRCTANLFWYNVATLCLGLIPFVIFVLIYRDATRKRVGSVQSEAGLVGPVNKEEAPYDRQGRPQLKPEQSSKTSQKDPKNGNKSPPTKKQKNASNNNAATPPKSKSKSPDKNAKVGNPKSNQPKNSKEAKKPLPQSKRPASPSPQPKGQSKGPASKSPNKSSPKSGKNVDNKKVNEKKKQVAKPFFPPPSQQQQ